jgi:hypothetical protein
MTTTPIISITDELISEIERVYLAGWEASGEGWNAEYQGDAHETKPFIDRMQQSCLPLTTELRRLRAENEALKTSLNTSRADHAAAMVWLTNMRFAAGDDGKLMFPELVAHIEALRVDAGRYRYIRSDGIPDPAIAMADSYYGVLELVSPDRLDTAIDTAMQSNTEGK